MNLNDYIKLSAKRPNRAVLQGLGASEELIEYLMETPNNTNWNVVGSLSGSGNNEDSAKRLIVFEGTITTEYNEALMSSQTIINSNIPTSLTKCFVTYNGVEYILPYDNVMGGYGKSTFSDQGMPIGAFDDFPCYVWPGIKTGNFNKIIILTSSNTTCTIKIEIENPISDEYGTLLLYEIIDCFIDNDGSYNGSGETILSLDTIPEQITVIFDEVVYQNITNRSYTDSFGIYGDLELTPFNIQLAPNYPCVLHVNSYSTHLVTVYYTP